MGHWAGPLWQFAQEKVCQAWEEDLAALEACERWHSGAYLLETEPCVYILMRHGHAPEEATIRAVNDTRDNDTIAAIIGAAVGALHGRQGLPRRWLEGLAGRTAQAQADDVQVFRILDEARRIWWDDE